MGATSLKSSLKNFNPSSPIKSVPNARTPNKGRIKNTPQAVINPYFVTFLRSF